MWDLQLFVGKPETRRHGRVELVNVSGTTETLKSGEGWTNECVISRNLLLPGDSPSVIQRHQRLPLLTRHDSLDIRCYTCMLLFANRARISELGTSAKETNRSLRTIGTSALSYIEQRSRLVTASTSPPLKRSTKSGSGVYAPVGTVATYVSLAKPLKIAFAP